MLNTLPVLVLFPIHLIMQLCNLAFWALAIICLGIIKLILPIPALVGPINICLNLMLSAFGIISLKLITLTNKVELDYQIDGELSKHNWYLMISNHLSWLDIAILTDFAAGRIPAPKFFLKRELIWVPFIGLGAWALDMPFMQRHSRELLEKYPHLQDQDINTTRKSCEKFRQSPTTVINFVEGSRFTPEKHQYKKSSFKHLLPPKAGGIAFTLAAMGELFTNVLDVSIVYPDNPHWAMLDMLCGRLNKVIIRVKVLPVDEQIIGDYYNDEAFKTRFQAWLNSLWQHKDNLIGKILESK
jgi:1-acyl-sn-glycerol-3-phosphate acyltransferase